MSACYCFHSSWEKADRYAAGRPKIVSQAGWPLTTSSGAVSETRVRRTSAPAFRAASPAVRAIPLGIGTTSPPPKGGRQRFIGNGNKSAVDCCRQSAEEPSASSSRKEAMAPVAESRTVSPSTPVTSPPGM